MRLRISVDPSGRRALADGRSTLGREDPAGGSQEEDPAWAAAEVELVGVGLPLTCVLHLLRYVRGRAAPYSLLILFLGTMFPVTIGWPAAADFLRGPSWSPSTSPAVSAST